MNKQPQPKYKFGDKVESIGPDRLFDPFEIKHIGTNKDGSYYYGISQDGPFYHEDLIHLYPEPVLLTRDKLISAWEEANGCTWSNSNEYETIQGLLEYFGFDKIG